MIDFHGFREKAKSLSETFETRVKTTHREVEGLSYCLYRQTDLPDDVILVYHGGGVNRKAGYDILARQLTANPQIAVCLVDIRGHGESIGEPGTVERPERVWQDVDVLLAEMQRYFPEAHHHLLGHSSGAGMLLNFLTRYSFTQQVDSLIMLAPALGPFASGIARAAAQESRFSQARQWPFILNAMSGGLLFGHYPAVSLNFPLEVREAQPDFVCHYSVNMANALIPRDPARQLGALPIPTLILAAEEDELFCPLALRDFVHKQDNTRLQFCVLEGSHHLGCMFEAQLGIQQFIASLSLGSGNEDPQS